MKEYSFTSDLSADDIRCKINNINKEGEERYITVWNIKGERRSQVLEELKEITELTEDDTEIFNRFYVGLILEFTDLVLDTDDILFMINDGTLVSRMLLQEFNDMANKLQLINIQQMTMDDNGEIHIETKKEEQTNIIENKSIQLESPINTYPEIDINNLPWFERLILYIKNIINKIKNIFK